MNNEQEALFMAPFPQVFRLPLSKVIFSFQIKSSYVQYSMEKLAGDVLLGSELVKIKTPYHFRLKLISYHESK